MPWWIWTVLGVVAWFFLGWRPIFRSWVEDFSPMTFGMLCAGVVTSIAMSWMGPFWLIGSMGIWNRDGTDTLARVLAGESRMEKRKRRERELKAREARVARLERDLGIGQDAYEGAQ
jgi:hypothetical protein